MTKRRPLRAAVARNIREAADDRKMSLNRLADLSGVSRSQLYGVLAQQTAPSIIWLERIANALDVDIMTLVDCGP